MSSAGTLSVEALTPQKLAERVAIEIPEGWYVNLGIGIPTLIADAIPAEREVIFHSENGILGMGSTPAVPDPWLINAGKQYVSLVRGGCYFHHADSFAMIRGRHLDLSVLGAFEVAENGDIANWATLEKNTALGVGGAMDLATGAKRVWVVMEHTTKDGRPRIVRRCTYPLTALGVVQRIFTNLAVLDVTSNGIKVVEMVPGMTFDVLQSKTEATLLA